MASHLKAAGKAILNSPKALRRKLAGNHDETQHGKLDEDWYHSDDPIKTGVSFYVKYLGSTEVTKTHGPGSTDDAVKQIVHHAKQRGGKLQKVQITVSSRLIKIQDVGNQIKLEEIPLYRVSYCTVDPYYDKVFCYISRNHESKKLECHAFLCNKKSKAEAITLTVAQAFNIAFERWQAQKKKKAARQQQQQEHRQAQQQGKSSAPITNGGGLATKDTSQAASLLGEELIAPVPQPVVQPAQPSPLLTSQQKAPSQPTVPPTTQPAPPTVIEPVKFSPPPPSGAVTQTSQAMAGLNLSSSTQQNISTNPFATRDDTHVNQRSGLLEVKPTMTKAISLDYISVDDEFDLEFTRLAEARSNPHLLDIGDHMNRSTSRDEVSVLMKGEGSSAVSDLSKTKSIDDLLML